MADNSIRTPGTGESIASVDIGGIKFQRVKVILGAGSVNDGDVSSSNPLPVDTELPAATALADGGANPTVPRVGANGLIWNGATWDRAPGNTTGQFVQGNVASGVADAGNPVKVGGVFNTTVPTLSSGQRADLQLSSRGELIIEIGGGGNVINSIPAPSADAISASANRALPTQALYYALNGTSWDRWRNNVEGTLLASAARTVQTDSANQVNYNARGVSFFVVVSAKAGATTLTLSLFWIDPVSGQAGQVASAPAWAAGVSGRLFFTVYPGALSADQFDDAGGHVAEAKSVPLPRTWFLRVAPSDASSVTYSVGYALIL